MLKRTPFIIAAIFCASFVNAQENKTQSETEISSELDKANKRAESKKWNKENTSLKPIIGIGAGIFNYIGEVNNNGRTNPLVNNYGIQARVIKNFTPSWGLEFDVVYGRISAREQRENVFRNFSSEVVTFNLQATYNFAALLPPNRVVSPFLSVGVGAINFDAKGDLKDANGATYYSWTDGTLRSLAQGSSDEASAEILTADYVYETDLRKANLDSLGSYSQFSATIPFTFGLNFRISPRSLMRLSSTFSYTFTDLIDNYTKDGIASRKGNDMNDLVFFTSVSYHFDFFSATKKKKSVFDDVDFSSFEGDDDKDGVADIADLCAGTPSGITVDENGCPMDSDLDGVYDYQDDEPNSPEGAVVNELGVQITDDMISLSEDDTLATERAKMFDVYPDMAEIYSDKAATVKNENTLDKFSIVDKNGDGMISVEEVFTAIDEFFDGKLDVNAMYINELIDFFFEQ